MKLKKYEKPTAEVTSFECCDVISLSTNDGSISFSSEAIDTVEVNWY